jgi:membrane protein DedA with SNARE-associated domain
MLEPVSLIENFPYLGIFVLLLLGAIGFPFPEDTTLILSGFLIANGIIDPLPAFLVIYGGLLLTDLSLFLVGKKYGRKVVEHKRFRRIISAERLSKIEEKFERWGIFVIFIGRHIIGIRAQVFLAAGVMRMSAMKFLFADGVSAIITVSVMVAIGYFGAGSIHALKEDVTRVGHLIVLTVIVVLAGVIFLRYLRNLKKFRK